MQVREHYRPNDNVLGCGLILHNYQAAAAGGDIRALIAYHHHQNEVPEPGQLVNIPGVSPFGIQNDEQRIDVLCKYMEFLHKHFVLMPPMFSKYPHVLMGDGDMPIVAMKSWPQSRMKFLTTINAYVQWVARRNNPRAQIRSIYDPNSNQNRYEKLYSRVAQYHRVCNQMTASGRPMQVPRGALLPEVGFNVNPVAFMRRELGGRQKFSVGGRRQQTPQGRPDLTMPRRLSFKLSDRF